MGNALKIRTSKQESDCIALQFNIPCCIFGSQFGAKTRQWRRVWRDESRKIRHNLNDDKRIPKSSYKATQRDVDRSTFFLHFFCIFWFLRRFFPTTTLNGAVVCVETNAEPAQVPKSLWPRRGQWKLERLPAYIMKITAYAKCIDILECPG